MIELNTADVLRASHVTRWQIVKVGRPQSVAEHTFGVIAIAMALLDEMDFNDLYEKEKLKARVAHYAFLHDLPEVVTGDIATPIKRVLGVSDKLKKIEEGMVYLDHPLHEFSISVKLIVKEADLIESILYLEHNANEKNGHVQDVLGRLRAKLNKDFRQEAWEMYVKITNQEKRPMTMDKLADVL